MYNQTHVQRAGAIRQWFTQMYKAWCEGLGLYADALALVSLYIPLVLVGTESQIQRFGSKHREDPFSDTSESEEAEDDGETRKPRGSVRSTDKAREGSSSQQSAGSQGVSSLSGAVLSLIETTEGQWRRLCVEAE